MHLKPRYIISGFFKRKKSKLFSVLLPYCFLFFLSFLIIPNKAQATHISGADLTYRWISGNTFEITLSLYRDCSGIAAPNSVSVNYKSASCGSNSNITLNKIAGTGIEITQPCSSATTTCNGGTNPGIQKYDYTGTVTLPSQCADWVFSYSVCCRNCAISTLSYTPNNCSGVPATYVEATLNNLADPTNSSPAFTNPPLSFLCLGQTFHYNHGAYDSDGDSLVYSLIAPRSAQGTDVVFKAGYSATNPISSSPVISINSSNGDMVMNPSAVEVAVMEILINEYHNGVLVGTVVRDMEIWTQACTNTLPVAGGINGTGNYNIIACPGIPISFTLNSSDADAAQSVTMSWNNGIPGANFSVSASTRPTGTFTWTPTAADSRDQPYAFTITVQDDACPSNGYQTYSYTVLVPQFTASITSINSNCAVPPAGTATVFPTGDGPFQYLWSNGGAGTTINSLSPGTYSVQVTDANGCTLNPTVTITAPAVLNATLNGISQITCNGAGNGAVSVTASGGTGTYTYSWSPSGGNTATASSLSPGTYTVTVTDSKGCTKTASTTITQPSVLTATSTGSALLCFGMTNGTASVSPAGGTAPYSYLWSNSATTAGLTSLIPGSYSVTITDTKGCTISKTVNVTQPTALNLSTSTTQALCGLANGSATATISGGTPGYTYNWLPGGSNSPSITNLFSGNYSVTVTDNNGCTSSSAVGVPGVTGPSVNLTALTQVSCFGMNNGSATVSLTGGSGPFVYNWSPSGGSSATASGLAADNYIVTITDANNCTTSLPVNITQPTALQLNITKNDPTCFALNNGSVSVTASGGTPGYNYTWNGGFPNISTLNNLSPGIYSVVINDLNGCVDSVTTTLTEPAQLTGNVTSITDVSCFGGNNGNATISSSGGTTPYSYQWSPGGYTLPSASGLPASAYTVQVTDANNCSVSIPLTINEPTLLICTIDSFQSVLCNGGNNGSAQSTVAGGTSPYSYTWNPNGETTSALTNLVAGTYSITVNDSNGCITNASINITEPSPLTAILWSSSDVSCFGGNDGKAMINASGGTMPYSYQWSVGGITGNASTALTADNYSVIVTDANGCSITVAFTINQPALLTATVASTPALCNDSATGSVSVNATGGSTPYNYLWSSGDSTASCAGKTAGNYSVLITDLRGCTFSTTTTVTEPTPLSANVTIVNAKCGKPNGSATISASGGTAGYTYLWSNNATTPVISNKVAGTYSVIVSDANGCSITQAAPISNLAAPVINITSITDVSCPAGNNGAASINVSGGALPYDYSWAPSGGTGATATGLTVGTYLITVEDNHHCISIKQVDISEPPPFNFSLSSTAVTCRGGNNGDATVNVTGGTGALTYIWNTGVSGNAISNKTAGTYTITVTDQNSCTASSPVTINEPSQLSATMNIVVPVSCNGAQDASAQINASGGIPPYSYSWNEFANTSQLATGLKAGNYSSTTTDANGCIATSGLTITEPQTLVAQTSTIIGTCDNPNGQAFASANGGTSPYSYFWQQTGETTSAITGLVSGTYDVTVTDISGCQSTAAVNVQNTGLLSVSLFSAKQVSCYGGNDGEAIVSASAGSPPYTYSWSSGGTNAQEGGLIAGTYNVIVTDTNNCVQSLSVLITEPMALSATVTVTDLMCKGAANGSASVNAAGGTGNYMYDWQPGGSFASSVSSLTGGAYSVKVTDENGCSTTTPFSVFEPTALTLSTSSTLAGCMLSNGTATALPAGGTPPYSYQWSPGQSITDKLEGIPAGSYSIVVTDANSCSVTTQASVSNTTGPGVAVSSNKPPLCFNGTDGIAEISIINGTGPFTYNWFPSGGTSLIAGNLSAGDYSFTVRDSNNCFGSMNITISEPAILSAALSTQAVSCYNGNNGTIQSSISGGTPPYQYQWSNGDTTSLASQLYQGTYSLMITDANGCQQQFSANLNEPSDLILDIQSFAVNCNSGNDGFATINATGGSGVYTYAWSNGSTSSAAMNLQKGTYTVTVTDAHGCTQDTSFIIDEPPALTGIIQSAPVLCYGGNNGNASVQVMGGSTPYNYEWLPYGGHDGHANNLSTGNFTVTIHDDHNCMMSIPVTVGSPTEMNVNVTADSVHCFGGQDGGANVIISGGINPYSAFWNTGSSSFNITQLSAGEYIVSVTDSNGCLTQKTVTVNESTPVIASTNTPDSICIGQPSTLLANASGGNPSYTYSWNNGSLSPETVVSPSATTNYLVVATDTYGCSSSPQMVTVPVKPPLSTLMVMPDTVCEGTSVVLMGFCSGGNGGPYNYSWDNGQNTQAITVTPAVTTSYTITATDQCGTPPSVTNVVVNVSPNPHVFFTQNVVTGCQPLKVDFTDSTDVQSKEFFWSFGDGETSVSNNPTHIYAEPGNYTVSHVVKSEMGCESRMTRSGAVKVYTTPEAYFTADPETASVFVPEIFFYDASANASKWYWDFGDKSGTVFQRNVSHSYSDTGSYRIRLITVSDKGCADTTYREILIKGEFAVYIPNAFSPNGDGINDRFTPLGLGIKSFEMSVYDRWGSKIYSTSDILKGWDGYDPGTGNNFPVDVYVYVVTIIDLQNKSHDYTGRISLVR